MVGVKVARATVDVVNIRTTMIDGDPWFVAADVCRALGLRPDASKDSRIEPTEFVVIAKQRDLTPSLLGLFQGTNHKLRLLSESGLYKLIMRSDKAEAVVFQNWVTQEILPSIRKTGKYAPADHGREALPLPMDIAEAQSWFQKAVAFRVDYPR
ncbi:BRO-N domain-containing protein [Brevundimonas guildfordensis]|uniref:BRO family protein n=1 Tax=Brevundimonas guildfordensis TaxID=2762241 RepID=A0ABR8R2X9_9CAUL|nr:BRO family protein [Brevundimonas guildfordensis]MBD7942150.1 BRO family protein [Brevundimonas guildfordensis]